MQNLQSAEAEPAQTKSEWHSQYHSDLWVGILDSLGQIVPQEALDQFNKNYPETCYRRWYWIKMEDLNHPRTEAPLQMILVNESDLSELGDRPDGVPYVSLDKLSEILPQIKPIERSLEVKERVSPETSPNSRWSWLFILFARISRLSPIFG